MLRFRVTACISLALIASATLGAPKPPAAEPAAEAAPKVVRAQAFELTDAAGKTRAWLGTLADGTTVLKLLDKEGKQKVLVDSRGEVTILDAQGTPRVTAGVMDADYGVAVFDSKGKIRADVRTSAAGGASMSVRDSSGNIRGTLVTLNDDPVFLLNDGKDNGARLAMHIGKSLPTFTLWDTAGKPRSSYSLLEGGAPLLQMKNAEGKTLAELSAAEEEPSLLLECPKSGMSAFMGFSADTDASVMLLNDQGNAQIGLMLTDRNPIAVVAHDNGVPGAAMRIDEDGIPCFYTADKENNSIWKSPDELTTP